MLSLLRKRALRLPALVVAVMLVGLGFLMWETTVAAIPASLVEQYALLKSIPAGWWPVITVFILSLIFFVAALGPDRLQVWGKAISDSCHRSDREIERLRAENQQLKGHVQQADQSEGAESAERTEWRRRFNAEIRHAFLKRYRDEAKALRTENEQLRVERDELEEAAHRESERELETQEQRGDQDALERYLDRMEQWVLDEEIPLDDLPYDHPRRRMTATRTREILRRLNPKQKRDVLRFLYEHELISKEPPVVRLGGADFSGSDLTRLEVWEANLDRVNLSGADLNQASMCGFHGHSASMFAAIERGSIDWEDSMIPDRSTSFLGANLSGAVLKRVRLAGCNLINANFDGADLEEADLRGADLQLARNLTQEQIESAFGSSGGYEYMPDTILPDHLTAPEAWGKLLSQQVKR